MSEDSEEVQANPKVFFVLMLIFGATCYGMYSHNKQSECIDDYFCVGVDEPWRLKHTLNLKSVNGLSKTESVVAYFLPEGSKDVFPLKVNSYNNHDWDDEISTVGLNVKGVSITDIGDPIELYVKVMTQDLNRFLGRKGTIHFKSNVVYPKIDLYQDNVIARSLANKIPVGEFSFENNSVEEEYKVSVQIIKANNKFRFWRVFIWLSGGLAGVFCLALLGSLSKN